MQGSYQVAPAAKDQQYLFQQIQQNLGWGPVMMSYKTLAEVSPEGLLLGKLDGNVISCCIALRYSQKFGFIAVYWVDQKHRGKRYGITIFQRAMAFLKDCDVIGLDSVMQQIPTYRKWGFEVACNSTRRYVHPIPMVDDNRSSVIITDQKQIDIKQVGMFDSKCFPAERENFVAKCFEIGQPFVAIDKSSKMILGYSVVTPCKQGYIMGPLIAINSLAAEDLLKEIFSFYHLSKGHIEHDKCLMAFVLDEKQYIKTLMTKYFPSEVYNCKRMYRILDNKDFDRSSIYAFTDYERG